MAELSRVSQARAESEDDDQAVSCDWERPGQTMGLLWGRRTSSLLVLVLALSLQQEAAAQKKLKQAVEKVVKKTSTEKPKLFTGKRF